MIKLCADLAAARDRVDENIAYGEAVPRLSSLKRTLLIAALVAMALLTIGYVNLALQVEQIQDQQTQERLERAERYAQAAKDRQTIIALLGQKRASASART